MKIILLTGKQKHNHTTKGIEGSLRTFFHEAITFLQFLHAIISHQKMQGFWELGANTMPGLCSEQQLRVVTSVMQNVTMVPQGWGSVIALLNTPLYPNLLISPLLTGDC